MERKNKYWPAVLAIFVLLGFFASLLWQASWPLLLLTLAVLGLACLFPFRPRLAFAALLIIRTGADFLTATELFSLGGIGVNFTSLTGIIVILLAVFSLFRERAWRGLPLAKPWLLFLGASLAVSLFSINGLLSLTELLRWLSFFALFVLGYSLFSDGKKSSFLIKSIILSSVIPALAAFWQLLNGLGIFDGERWRLSGTFVHPNMLAFYLVFIITLLLFLFLNLKRESLEKYVYLLFSLPLFVLLFFTYTRGAWICLFLVLFLIGLARFRLFLLSFLVIVLIFYVGFLPFRERLDSLMAFSAADSTVWRLELWRDSLEYAKDSWLIGHGPGTSAYLIGQHRSPLLGSSEPHNDYIKLILEVGLLGLGAYLFLLLSLLRRLWRGWRQDEAPRRRLLFLFMIVFSLALFISSAGDNILKDSSLQWSFWALLGSLLAGHIRLSTKEKAAS